MRMDLALTQVSQLAFGYWQAQVLFAATELGVFDALAGGPLPAERIAARCGVAEPRLRRLLDACVAQRLLTRTAEGYANAAHAQRLLVTDSPETLVHWVRVMGRWYRPWGGLAQAVRSGVPAEERGLRLGDDPAYLEDFILGMHEYNARSAAALPELVAQEDAKLLVDVGGGAGTYSLAFCRAWPGLECEVIDLPAVTEIARRTIAAAGLEDRIRVRAGDYYTDRFGQDADVVLLSNVLHQESREACLDILGRAARALRPGGRVLVNGHFLDDSRTSPPFTTLHNLSALVLWDGGGSCTATEMRELMAEAGLVDIEVHGTAEPSAKLLVGRAAHDH